MTKIVHSMSARIGGMRTTVSGSQLTVYVYIHEVYFNKQSGIDEAKVALEY
jgi:hypothetical protein